MDTAITREEFNTFKDLIGIEYQRLEDEDKRQNRRLDLLEETMKKMSELTNSVEKLALNMESMVEIQKQQGTRLTTLEGRDGKSWRDLKSKFIGTVISVLGGGILGALAAMIFK